MLMYCDLLTIWHFFELVTCVFTHDYTVCTLLLTKLYWKKKFLTLVTPDFFFHTCQTELSPSRQNFGPFVENRFWKSEPIFFTLTKKAMAKFYHRHMGEIYVMDQNNSVFLYERGFIQPEMGIIILKKFSKNLNINRIFAVICYFLS